MLEPTTLCERVLSELRARSSAGEHLSTLDSQIIVLLSHFVQINPTPERFVAQLKQYADGRRGHLLAEAAHHLLNRYQAAQVA